MACLQKPGNNTICSCKAHKGEDLTTYLEIVTDHRKYSECEFCSSLCYNTLPVAKAIESAALGLRCQIKEKKKHSHQWRIPNKVLETSRLILIKKEKKIQRCENFDSLFRIVDESIHNIHGIGELTVYDTAHRIGMSLNIKPEKVYLHAGTREGVKALGPQYKHLFQKKYILPKDLPEAFQVLSASEIEDCLCRYKKELFDIQKKKKN